jgi:hypothetical protein
LIIILVFIFVVAGCSGDEKITENDKETIEDILIIIQDVTSGGLSFIIENNTDKEYTYGEEYTLMAIIKSEKILLRHSPTIGGYYIYALE